MIELRLFKMAGMFVGANRRTGCKVLVVASDNLFVSSSNFNFATSRSCFEDYTCMFKGCLYTYDFGPDEAADKSLNVSRRVLKLFALTEA